MEHVTGDLNGNKHNVQVILSPVFELLASMYRLQSHKEIEQKDPSDLASEATKDSSTLILDQWVEQTGHTLPEFIKKELEVFFHYESFIGLTMVRFAWEYDCYQSIDAFLAVLKNTSADHIYSSFLQTGFTPEDTVDLNDPHTVIQFIKKSNLPEVEKWKLTYLYADLEETKNRLIKLISYCNEYYFSYENERWLAEQMKSAEEMNTLLEKNGRGILKNTFPYLNEEMVDSTHLLVLSPSYFYHKASLTSESSTDSSLIYVYGVQHMRSADKKTVDENQLIEAFKILADEKRLRIIKHLNSGPLYGYELAQKLELSNSTISHHLSVLASIGVVSSTRVENKVYFKVNKEELEELMVALTKSLIS